MKPISKFVREQFRYTKNDLRALFSFDDAEVEKFIKNLKSFGILKSVENKKDQKDLTELVDDDILISDETAGYDECLYVFTNVQFNTHRQILLKTMYAYISHNRRINEEDSGISLFGTNAFHAVWEKACADVFDNKLSESLGKLPMRSPLAEGYNKSKKLIDIIEKPMWIGKNCEYSAKDTMIPDTITISDYKGADCFYIFDAKYYLLQLEQNKPLKGHPGVSDITKQYLYQLAYKKFIEDHNIMHVRNCFLMPVEGDEIVDKGFAKMDMLTALGLKDIQIRLIPVKRVFSCYLNGKKISVEELNL